MSTQATDKKNFFSSLTSTVSSAPGKALSGLKGLFGKTENEKIENLYIITSFSTLYDQLEPSEQKQIINILKDCRKKEKSACKGLKFSSNAKEITTTTSVAPVGGKKRTSKRKHSPKRKSSPKRKRTTKKH